MEPVSDKDKRRETDMAGWRLYDAEKMITKRLLAENARLREELAATTQLAPKNEVNKNAE